MMMNDKFTAALLPVPKLDMMLVKSQFQPRVDTLDGLRGACETDEAHTAVDLSRRRVVVCHIEHDPIFVFEKTAEHCQPLPQS